MTGDKRRWARRVFVTTVITAIFWLTFSALSSSLAFRSRLLLSSVRMLWRTHQSMQTIPPHTHTHREERSMLGHKGPGPSLWRGEGAMHVVRIPVLLTVLLFPFFFFAEGREGIRTYRRKMIYALRCVCRRRLTSFSQTLPLPQPSLERLLQRPLSEWIFRLWKSFWRPGIGWNFCSSPATSPVFH